MRGEVLHYDEAQGFGFITGADGSRYTFRREDIRRAFPISRGVAVDFRESGNQARDVAAAGAEPQRAGAAAPRAVPVVTASPTSFGRDSSGDGTSGRRVSAGLWDYFQAGVTVNYANFRARARRKEYWSYCLLWFLLFVVGLAFSFFLDDAAGNFTSASDWPMLTVGFSAIFTLATFIPGLAVTVRRIHDVGLSGWFLLLVLLPYVGWLIILVFALIPSQKRENRWGPVPVGVSIPPSYLEGRS